MRTVKLASVVFISLVSLQTLTADEDQPAAALMPATTGVYAEVTHPKAVLDLLLDHPAHKLLARTDAYQHAINAKGFRTLRTVVSVVESQVGVKWREGLGVIAGGGIHIGLDAETEGVVVLMKAEDEEKRNQILEHVIKLSRDDARSKGQDDTFEIMDYRGISAYKTDGGVFAVLGPWYMFTNKADLGKVIADNFLDDADQSLAGSPRFAAMREAIAGSPAAWAGVDLNILRDAGAAKEVFSGRTDNVVAEVLVGGLLSNVRHAPFATAAIYFSNDDVRLRLATPHKPEWIGEEREYYFGSGKPATAPPLLDLPNTLLAISAYRDVSTMWLRGADLMTPKAVDQQAAADSGLSNLFSGKDFGEDILGALEPNHRLIAVRQDFADRTPQPAIKLPAFALVSRLRDRDSMQGELRRIFQSLIGFLNIIGASNAQPQLDLDMDKGDGFQLITSEYVPAVEDRDSREARINYNFSPSIAFVGDRFILASTKELATQLIPVSDGSDAGSLNDQPWTTNSQVSANAAVLRQVLTDNRAQLIAQNMLEKGHDEEAAESEVDAVLALLDVFRAADLRIDVAEDELQINLTVGLNATEP